MNCLEFRRKLLAEPQSQDTGFRDHCASCKACAHEAQQVLELDARLRHAYEVELPEGLASRILLAQSFQRRLDPSLVFRRVALAAGLMFVLAATLWVGLRWDAGIQSPGSLDTVVLNHIRDELHYLHLDRDVSRQQLAQLFSQWNARLRGEIGQVSYAGRCTIRSHSGIHLVMHGKHGPVTVLFMPGEHIEQPAKIRSSRFDGIIVPTAYGSMAIVGGVHEPVTELAEKINTSLAWGT